MSTASDTPTTLVELFEGAAARFGKTELFGTKTAGRWDFITYDEVAKRVAQCRGGLARLGVDRGDRVAIIAGNRVEWAVCAYATYGRGAVFVPMYESQPDRDWEFIIGDSGAKVVVASTAAIYDRIKDFPTRIATLKHIVVLDADARVEGSAASRYADVLSQGVAHPAAPVHPDPNDLATLIYTSGTTATPKGVMLTHRNIASNVVASCKVLPPLYGERSLSFLPWAHAFGHTAELHALVHSGGSLGLCEGPDKIIDNLAEVRPTILVSVPRVFNRIYTNVQKQIEGKPGPIRSLFATGLRLAKKRRLGEPLGILDKLLLATADKLVFTKIRARFGGRLKFAISGGAALSTEVGEFVAGLGIVVYEGYGLTETSPVAAVNLPGRHRIGSVGPLLPDVRVVIDHEATGDAKQGEIIIYGPLVMKGYYGHPEETAKVFTADGGFRSGDMGYLDDDGFLFITGRIKEQYKLENGKYVVPVPLEEALKLSRYVANVMVHGANRPANVALIVVEPQALGAWAAEHGLSGKPVSELVKNEQVRALYKAEIDRCSSSFKGYDRIRNFALIEQDFTQQNDMLTPKLSLKRRNIIAKWGAELDKLYASSTTPAPAS